MFGLPLGRTILSKEEPLEKTCDITLPVEINSPEPWANNNVGTSSSAMSTPSSNSKSSPASWLFDRWFSDHSKLLYYYHKKSNDTSYKQFKWSHNIKLTVRGQECHHSIRKLSYSQHFSSKGDDGADRDDSIITTTTTEEDEQEKINFSRIFGGNSYFPCSETQRFDTLNIQDFLKTKVNEKNKLPTTPTATTFSFRHHTMGTSGSGDSSGNHSGNKMQSNTNSANDKPTVLVVERRRKINPNSKISQSSAFINRSVLAERYLFIVATDKVRTLPQTNAPTSAANANQTKYVVTIHIQIQVGLSVKTKSKKGLKRESASTPRSRTRLKKEEEREENYRLKLIDVCKARARSFLDLLARYERKNVKQNRLVSRSPTVQQENLKMSDPKIGSRTSPSSPRPKLNKNSGDGQETSSPRSEINSMPMKPSSNPNPSISPMIVVNKSPDTSKNKASDTSKNKASDSPRTSTVVEEQEKKQQHSPSTPMEEIVSSEKQEKSRSRFADLDSKTLLKEMGHSLAVMLERECTVDMDAMTDHERAVEERRRADVVNYFMARVNELTENELDAQEVVLERMFRERLERLRTKMKSDHVVSLIELEDSAEKKLQELNKEWENALELKNKEVGELEAERNALKKSLGDETEKNRLLSLRIEELESQNDGLNRALKFARNFMEQEAAGSNSDRDSSSQGMTRAQRLEMERQKREREIAEKKQTEEWLRLYEENEMLYAMLEDEKNAMDSEWMAAGRAGDVDDSGSFTWTM
eukprot:g1702.t1